MAFPDPRPGTRVRPTVERKTVAMLTVAAIRERILAGEYREGTVLRQDAVAAELGVSRTPVREALRQLETEGLVEARPPRRVVVSVLSLDEIAELFEVRALIEGELVRAAVPRAGATEIAGAGEVLERYEAALRTGDAAAWGLWNWKFHSLLYAPAGRALTLGIVQGLHVNSDRYLRMQLALAEGVPRAMDEHRAIYRAVCDGDAQHAAALVTSHILEAGSALLKFLRLQRREPTRRSRTPARAEARA